MPSYFPAVRYGGTIVSVHALATAQAAHGHHVEAFTTNVDGPGDLDVPTDVAQSLGGVLVTYFPTSSLRRLYHSPAMKAALRQRLSEFDVVHLHSVFLWPTMAAAREAGRRGIPYVLAPRGMLVRDLISAKNCILKSAWIRLFEARNLRGAAAIHVTSAIEADEIRTLDLACAPLVEIPNGVDLPSPLPMRGSIGSDAPKRVVSLGRLNWKKGLDDLMRACAQLENVQLIIAGNDEGGYESGLRALAAELGVAGRVVFPGPVYGEDKWRLLASADVFAMPSVSENFGNAALEALAVGTPVLLTRGVGLAPAVAAAGAGIIVDKSPQAIAAGLSEALSDHAGLRRMGEAGARLVADQYRWDAIAARTIDLYRSFPR